MGVPVKLGAKGIEKIFEIKLESGEQAALQKSAAAVQELVDVIKSKMYRTLQCAALTLVLTQGVTEPRP